MRAAVARSVSALAEARPVLAGSLQALGPQRCQPTSLDCSVIAHRGRRTWRDFSLCVWKVIHTRQRKTSDILRTPWRRARRAAKALRPRSYNRRPRSHNRPDARVFSQVPAHRPQTRLAQQKNPVLARCSHARPHTRCTAQSQPYLTGRLQHCPARLAPQLTTHHCPSDTTLQPRYLRPPTALA